VFWVHYPTPQFLMPTSSDSGSFPKIISQISGADLSHPKGHSVNSGISKELCSLSYVTLDNAIQQAQSLGRGTLLMKIDIKNAFCLLPVHPTDRHLLVMRWKQQLYIDTCLPFGLPSTPKLFNVLTDLLSWILERQGVSLIMLHALP